MVCQSSLRALEDRSIDKKDARGSSRCSSLSCGKQVYKSMLKNGIGRADFMTPGGVVCRYRQTSEGSFSAVSRPIFASKDAFFRIFRDLQDARTLAPLQIQNFRKFSCKIADFDAGLL